MKGYFGLLIERFRTIKLTIFCSSIKEATFPKTRDRSNIFSGGDSNEFLPTIAKE